MSSSADVAVDPATPEALELPTELSRPGGLRSAAIQGSAWTAGSSLSQRLVQLGITVVLARLLLPREYGLIGMIVAFTGFALLFVDSGFGAAIVQRKHLTAAHLSTAFWLNVGAGVVLAGLSAAFAPLVARFYNQPRIAAIMPVAGLSFFLVSLIIVQVALLQRRMMFRRIAFVENVSLASSGAIAIACAFAGLGVWSLVIFSLASNGVEACLLWFSSEWRPAFSVDRQAFRELWGFGGGLLGSNAVNYWNRNADNLLIGRFVGAAGLGLYTRGYSLVLLQMTSISAVVGRTLFPALSRMHGDIARIRHAYLQAVGVIAFVTFPLAIGLFVTAKPLILTLLGPRWIGVVPIVQILAIAGVSDSIGTTTGVIFQAQGRTDILFRWQLIVGVVVIASFGVGVHWGVKGVAVAYAVASVGLRYPGFVIAGRLIGMRFRDVVQTVWAVLAAALVAGVGAWAVGRTLSGEASPVQLLAELAAGGVAYLALCHVARLEPYRELLGMVRRRAQTRGGTRPGIRGLTRGKGLRLAHVPCASLSLREIASALLHPLEVADAEAEIARLTGAHAVLFASCRGALAAAVATLSEGGCVAICGYTCTAVPNAIRSGGATPIYVDVDERGLVPAEDWPRADAVVAQDTFGFVAPIPAGRLVIRDAALSSRDFAPQPGVAVSVTSFEQSKALSAGEGGLALSFDAALAARMRDRRDTAPPLGRGVSHTALTALQLAASRLRYRGIERFGLRAVRIFGALSPMRMAGQSLEELEGGGVQPRLLGPPPRTAARLMVEQLRRADELARQRAEIVALYDRAAGVGRPAEPLSRYPMVVSNLDELDEELRKIGWVLGGRWFEAPLHPAGTDPSAFGYEVPPDSTAVRLSRSVINLPTHRLVTTADARELIAAALAAGAVPLGLVAAAID